MHILLSFLQNFLNQEHDLIQYLLVFFFEIFLKTTTTERKKILSHIHCSRKGRAARITLTIVSTQSGGDTGKH